MPCCQAQAVQHYKLQDVASIPSAPVIRPALASAPASGRPSVASTNHCNTSVRWRHNSLSLALDEEAAGTRQPGPEIQQESDLGYRTGIEKASALCLGSRAEELRQQRPRWARGASSHRCRPWRSACAAARTG